MTNCKNCGCYFGYHYAIGYSDVTDYAKVVGGIKCRFCNRCERFEP